ncbi:MAG TPA: DUF3108 domain-containing protein [Hyphomicrobium sp.]|nr:DUF3108 domain-containing protein [Hyphomicrobium sp.]
MYQSSRRVASCVAALGSAALAALSAGPAAAQAIPATLSSASVDAGYRVTLNGFDLGTFSFKSNVGDSEYTLHTNVELSALLGVFRWKGVTQVSGSVGDKRPAPSDFRFDYESSVRNGSVIMGFDKNNVDHVTVLPVVREPEDTVPLERKHLANVLDPLSAILVLTHSDAATPCGRTVAIFDGKQRFNISLHEARKITLAGTQGERATVCRVKYTPLSGYRANAETRHLAQTKDIEITFRMVPAAKLMVPQSVSVPTGAGTARIDLERISIQLPERGRVASVD